jgi:glutathione synthetase
LDRQGTQFRMASIVKSTQDDRTKEAIAWASCNGFMVRSQKDNNLFDHAPFTLYPTVYPSTLYEKAKTLTVPFNLLVDRVARNDEWLRATLDEAAKVDPFVADQMKIYKAVMKEGISQQTYLGIHRSDYMIHSPSSTGETKEEERILQVELNTIAASFGCLSTKVNQMHQYLQQKEKLFQGSTTNSSKAVLANNNAPEGLANAIHKAHKQYISQREDVSSPTSVLFVVQDGETNTVDQRMLEFELTNKHHIPVLRRSLTSLSKVGSLSKVTGTTTTNVLMVEGHEISVVYYRAGYTPNDYPSDDEWSARLMVERSYAIKCPSIAYQLVGAKKVQQQLANEGELEKFLSKEEGCDDCKSTFAGLWQVDDESVKMVLETGGEGYVMKPQREGGGNNIYGKDIVDALKNMNDKEERLAYIFMELIQPPENQGILVKAGVSSAPQGTLSELGIYSSFLGNGNVTYHSNYIGKGLLFFLFFRRH